MYRGIEHIAICAEDTEKLAQWYVDTFGFEVCYKNSKTPPTLFVKQLGGSMIEIMPADGARPERGDKSPGIAHLAIAVDDFDASYEDLKAKGVNFTGEPKEASGGVKVVFFTDPEGNLIQTIYRPNPL